MEEKHNTTQKDWRVLEFFVPIEESFLSEDDDFMIRGVAINETTTLNNVKYVAEELQGAAASFRNVPILLDHKNEVLNIVGRTTERVDWNPTFKRIDFEAKIMDKDIQERIKDGRIGSVSIGAKVDNLTEEDDGSMKAIGVRGLEISLVAVPGDSGATLAHALQNSFHLKEMAMEKESQSTPVEKLNKIGENNMSEEEQKEDVQTPEVEEPTVEEPVEEVKAESEETPEEEVKEDEVAEEKVSKELTEMRKQISALKELLVEKKQIKEKAMVDKTQGEVSVKTEEALKDVDNRIVEAVGRGTFSMYRDYNSESAESNLKRLVR